MILVLLGTQDKPFNRLLDAVQTQIDLGKIKGEIVVQAGCTKYNSKEMKIFDLIPVEEFDGLIKKADVVITHGGVGSIITALKNNKKVIAAARLKKYGEHVNDHQEQIIDRFVDLGYLLKLTNFNELGKIIDQIKRFSPIKYKSTTNKIIDLIENFIENN